MATSGSWNYSVTAADIIKAALEDLGVVIAGASVTANDSTLALQRLNFLAKQWQGVADGAPGLKIWTRQRLVLFPVKDQARYLIGPASTDDRASVDSLATTLGAAKAASATAITVSSTTGMTAADILGFVTDAGTVGWTTISSVDTSTTLTAAANTVGAAASGKVVYTYTNKAQRFPAWESVVLRDNSSVGQPIDIPLGVYTDVAEYEALSQKLASGDPTAILIEPQRLNTAVTLNYAATSMFKTLRLNVLYPAEDYDATTDDIAFPQEWYAALEWELAFRLATAFERPWTKEMEANRVQAVGLARPLNSLNVSDYFLPEKEPVDG